MKKIFVFALLFILLTSSSVLGQSGVPTPTYRIPMGQEIEYMSKTLQQLNYLNNMVGKLEDTMQLDTYNSKMVGVITGNRNALDVLANEDFDQMSGKDMENWFANDAYRLFEDKISFISEVGEDTSEIWEENATKEVELAFEEGDPIYRKIKEEDTEINESKDNEDVKQYKKRVKELQKKNERLEEEMKELKTKYDKEESETTHFIEKEKEKMKTRINDMQTEDISLKGLSELLLHNNLYQLKMIETQRDMMNQLIQINTILIKEHSKDSYMKIENLSF